MEALKKEFKGLWVYIFIVAMGLCYLGYSQYRGHKWMGATHTERPDEGQQRGYRYFNHK